MSWRTARSLDVILSEINAAAPHRDRAADGSIGDQAHQAQKSDHNPNSAGVVRARDFTHDPRRGLDCNVLAAYLFDRLGELPALTSGAYIIWNSRIASYDRLGEGWRPYAGSNPHSSHLHLSVATSAAGYDDTSPFGWGIEEDDMPAYRDWPQADKNALAEDVARAVLSTQIDTEKGKRSIQQIVKELWNKRNI